MRALGANNQPSYGIDHPERPFGLHVLRTWFLFCTISITCAVSPWRGVAFHVFKPVLDGVINNVGLPKAARILLHHFYLAYSQLTMLLEV